MQTKFIQWSPEATWSAIAASDLVMVPSFDDHRKRVKGPNRVIESLRLGRFVVAYPLPSYVPLGQYTWLGKDLAAGIRWAVDNPANVLARVRAGQKYVAARFTAELVTRAWESVMLRETLGSRAAVPALQILAGKTFASEFRVQTHRLEVACVRLSGRRKGCRRLAFTLGSWGGTISAPIPASSRPSRGNCPPAFARYA